MFPKVALVSLLLTVVGVVAQVNVVINTPSGVVECQNTQLTWTGSTNVTITLYPGGETTGALEVLPPIVGGTSVTWLADVAPGSYTFGIKDLPTGALNYCAPFTITASSDTTCLGKNPQSGSTPPATSGAPSGTTPGGTSTTTPPSNPPSSPSTPGGTTPSATGAGATSPSGTTKPATTSSSAASPLNVNIGAGFFGLVAVLAGLL